MSTALTSRVIKQYLFLFSISVIAGSCRAPDRVINAEKYYTYECRNIVSSLPMDTLSQYDLERDTMLLSTYTIVDLQLANAFGLIDHLRKSFPQKDVSILYQNNK